VVGGTPAGRRFADTVARTLEGEAPGGWFSRSGPLGVRRSALATATLLFLVLLAGGVAARAMLEPPPPPPEPVAAVQEAPPTPAPAPAAAKSETPAQKKLAARVAERKAERAEKIASMARVELAVAPWGEIVVDGKSRGVSPPLRFVELVPGAHTVEIRNSTFPAHVEKVSVKAGETARIRHRFK
jgi:hypothetical protein